MESKILMFDLWLEGRWVGMSQGATLIEARELVNKSFNYKSVASEVLMLPFYGSGTSDETYEACTGKKPVYGFKL